MAKVAQEMVRAAEFSADYYYTILQIDAIGFAGKGLKEIVKMPV
jgi:ferritin-like protein